MSARTQAPTMSHAHVPELSDTASADTGSVWTVGVGDVVDVAVGVGGTEVLDGVGVGVAVVVEGVACSAVVVEVADGCAGANLRG